MYNKHDNYCYVILITIEVHSKLIFSQMTQVRNHVDHPKHISHVVLFCQMRVRIQNPKLRCQIMNFWPVFKFYSLNSSSLRSLFSGKRIAHSKVYVFNHFPMFSNVWYFNIFTRLKAIYTNTAHTVAWC